MKTQNTNLKFTKNSLVELNNKELLQINGGTSSALCAAAAAAVAVAAASSQGCAQVAAGAVMDAIQNLTNE